MKMEVQLKTKEQNEDKNITLETIIQSNGTRDSNVSLKIYDCKNKTLATAILDLGELKRAVAVFNV